MKCIVNKKNLILFICLILICSTGCVKQEIVFEQKYDIFETTEKLEIGIAESSQWLDFFGEDLCVGGHTNISNDQVTDRLSEGSALFHMQDLSVVCGKNVHKKLYPASTTKILTAYIALKYGDLQEKIFVSEEALDIDPNSSTCGLSIGDHVTLEQLLYGLMLCSGNDAANVIAEMISGSVSEFAGLMNKEALALGATNSNFVNPHGLHDEQHYTTVYDLQLIFKEALKNEEFRKIIGTTRYKTEYPDRNGEIIAKDWGNTNRYLTGDKEVPEGIHVIGGKTGTTYSAGNCLVLYVENSKGIPFISIVLKAESRDDLYYQMSEMLQLAESM